MSQKRQTAFLDRSKDARSHITSLTRDYPAGHVIPLHFHDRDQLVYASRGVMTVRTVDGVWVVPTRRAVWIPALVPHTISMSGTVAMRTLYLRPRLAKKLPRSCCVVHISGLMKELIVHACTLGSLRRKVQWQGDLIAVIIRHLRGDSGRPFTASKSNGSESTANRESALRKSGRSAHSQCFVQGGGREQEDNGTDIPGGCESHARRPGIRLQHTQRLYLDVQEIAGNDARSLFQDGFIRGQITSFLPCNDLLNLCP